VVPAAAFRYVKGEPRLLQSSEHGRRYFCADCGTPLACLLQARPDEVDVTTGSLDRPGDYPPTLAVHEDTKLPWLKETEVRPQ
jgi:hypothetical protein